MSARLDEYAETGGPFPERLPVISLAMRFYLEQAATMMRWLSWAESATDDWTGVTIASGARVPEDAFTPAPGLAATEPSSGP